MGREMVGKDKGQQTDGRTFSPGFSLFLISAFPKVLGSFTISLPKVSSNLAVWLLRFKKQHTPGKGD